MAVLMEFAIFPLDKGKSVSKEVASVIAMIEESGYHFELTPMGTIIETETVAEALAIVEQAALILDTDCERIYSTIKLDIKKGAHDMLHEKVQSIKEKLI